MPITVASNLTASGTTTPVVSTDLVIHLPEEILALANAADRDGTQIVVCCRSAEQAATLAEKLLAAAVGSAILSGGASPSQVRYTVEAFGYGDFTVLLTTDDLYHPWQVGDDVALLHADLPAPHGALQLMTAISARLAHIGAGSRVA